MFNKDHKLSPHFKKVEGGFTRNASDQKSDSYLVLTSPLTLPSALNLPTAQNLSFTLALSTTMISPYIPSATILTS
jgi:hypothetical protein